MTGKSFYIRLCCACPHHYILESFCHWRLRQETMNCTTSTPVLPVQISLPRALEMHSRIVAAVSQLLDLVDGLQGFWLGLCCQWLSLIWILEPSLLLWGGTLLCGPALLDAGDRLMPPCPAILCILICHSFQNLHQFVFSLTKMFMSADFWLIRVCIFKFCCYFHSQNGFYFHN